MFLFLYLNIRLLLKLIHSFCNINSIMNRRSSGLDLFIYSRTKKISLVRIINNPSTLTHITKINKQIIH